MTTTCRECNAPFVDTRATGAKKRGRPKMFCNWQCRQRWNNRRSVRGAELYDFVMAWRFERSNTDMMAQIARLASAYRDADKKLRGGRPSWNAEEAQLRLPLGFGTDGDGR